MAAPAALGRDMKESGVRMITRLLVFSALACSLRADSFFLIVSGLGGEPEYEQRFSGWAKDLDKIAHTEPNAKVDTLIGPDATKVNIESKLRALATSAKAGDSLVVMLIGHGSYDESNYKFNIPGPDISATDLAALLDKIPAQQLIVDMPSSSGGSIPLLQNQKMKRVIVTATKSGTEKNATVFARYWIEAMRDPAADTDKNEVITALEAFRYAEQKTAKFFETQNRLATEHALIEDTGKGDGVKAPAPENGQGMIAGRFGLVHMGSVAALIKDPAKQQLLKHKEELEQSIDELKYKKASMALPDYRRQLETYLVDLAKTQEELDK
jgi:hypothetical protein